ncbi:MAG: arginine--tRNA ligase [Magnetococcales bacterium]|nr:arginine--tRNA ligase [Magnetococcales bacterium]MBF0115989.1 arginine--tRNA ligase [Magnetococcales bacterium]
MHSLIQQLVSTALQQLQQQGLFAEEQIFSFQVERPRDKNHGDFATNAALVLAKTARLPPRQLAERILAALPAGQTAVERCEVAGPGFINFFLTPHTLQSLILTIAEQGTQYGRSQVGAGRRLQVEFVSANPTGPMHLGHGRGAVNGDVIVRLLQAIGCQVEREYYINDAGAQTLVLGRSVLIRYHALFGQEWPMPEGCYPGDYVRDIAIALRDAQGDRWLTPTLPDHPPGEVVDFAIARCLEWIREDLERLNIPFDTWFSERSLHTQGMIAHAIVQLEAKDLIYEGILEPPKGKQPEDWEARPQRLFRSSQFGDEVDRALQKSDGTYTYFAADIAYHLNKAERGFDTLINIWGADHGGYIKRVQSALAALTGRHTLLEVRLVQMVNLFRAGQPVRMSKRAGTFVTLREVVEETGADAVRFWFLLRSSGASLDFDLELAMAKTNENPVFYVQYAHARVHSLRRRLQERGGWVEVADARQLQRLSEEAELELLRLLSRYPEVVEQAALEKEPQKIPHYLLELAAAFHTYYNGHKILDEDTDLRAARLALANATGQVIANGLTLLGVHAPEQM